MINTFHSSTAKVLPDQERTPNAWARVSAVGEGFDILDKIGVPSTIVVARNLSTVPGLENVPTFGPAHAIEQEVTPRNVCRIDKTNEGARLTMISTLAYVLSLITRPPWLQVKSVHLLT